MRNSITSGLTKRESATDQDKSSVQSTETTKLQSQNPAPIDEAVSLIIKAQSKGYELPILDWHNRNSHSRSHTKLRITH